MKKQVKKVISLQKLTIARVQTGEMNHIKGGDCIPTSHCYEDGYSDWYCPTSEIP